MSSPTIVKVYTSHTYIVFPGESPLLAPSFACPAPGQALTWPAPGQCSPMQMPEGGDTGGPRQNWGGSSSAGSTRHRQHHLWPSSQFGLLEGRGSITMTLTLWMGRESGSHSWFRLVCCWMSTRTNTFAVEKRQLSLLFNSHHKLPCIYMWN